MTESKGSPKRGAVVARVDTNEPAPANSPTTFPIVGVGASAGGMEAFTELLRHISPGAGMAFVLIQHLDPTHPSYLSEALSRSTSFPVHEIQDGMRVEPDHVYVIPSDADVGILKGTLALLARSSNAQKPHLPIDFFFKALAADSGNQAIGVVLSGTGSDGAEGLRAIKAEDGVTFAQEPQSARFAGMPEAAMRTGVVDFCLRIPDLARELLRIGRHPFLRGHGTESLVTASDDTDLRKALVLVRSVVGIDFSEYKLSSIRRRLARRMALRRLTTLKEYVRLLQEDRAEVEALFEDIFIHVTSFFRDGEAFEKLKDHVFPEILMHKRTGGTIRVWCPGCSTGEEAYSVLIALLEYLEQVGASDVPVQLFGTDVSEKAVDKARAGVYPETAIRDLSPERLARFFTKANGGGYGINKPVRERCAFVRHDLASDPPFSKLDLVTCRNVLIYFAADLQKRVLATFHFALNEPGFLLLGHAENVFSDEKLFHPIDRENKIFVRTEGKGVLRLAPVRHASPVVAPFEDPQMRSAPDIVRRAESLLLERYVPPGVIVNGRMEILHFRGRTGPYLEPAPGQPQHDLMKMARKGLVADLRIAISEARKQKTTVHRSGVRVEQDGASILCDLVVVPITSPPESRDDVFAVLFVEPVQREAPTQTAGSKDGLSRGGGGEGTRPPDADVGSGRQQSARLAEELKATKEYLQSIIEEHQRANEQLLSSNEELVSSNEELQSLNEELQTAKEELQSTNEELSTLNEELQTRNAEVNTSNSDLMNVLASVEVPIVIVDGLRRIRRFTPKARPILNLLPVDVGRAFDDIKPGLPIEQLDQKIADVIETLRPFEEEVQGPDGHWYRLQIRPYTTIDKKIDGAVLSVVDIDALKRALGAAEWARDYALATVEAVPIPLLVFNERFEVVSANRAFQGAYGVARQTIAGRSIHEILDGVLNLPAIRSALERAPEGKANFQGLEIKRELLSLGPRVLSLSAGSVGSRERGFLLLLAVEDITERRNAEAERSKLLHEAETAKSSAEQANRAKDVFLATLSHELRTPLTTLLLSSQLLSEGHLDPADTVSTAEAIVRATKAQAQLIDDLLDVSRIVTGKLKMEPRAVSLAAVVRSVIDTVRPAAETKQIDLQVGLDESLPPVSGDPVRLQQVVSNLLTNAIKFTPTAGHVAVSVDASEGRARIRVTDTGVGIEPSFLPSIFNLFSQEEQGRTRSYGGLGLGLAIVRAVVEAHGGTVQAASAGRGKGSTFTVSLPLMTNSETRGLDRKRQPSIEVVGNVRGARVLLVEDDADTRDALTEVLKRNGALVRSADSAAAAMEVFEEFRPQLLVCDIAMADEDGYSLLGRIRALGPKRSGDVPALALTALAGDDDRRRALEAGFQAHVAKPVDIEGLITVLTTLLKPRAPGPETDHGAPQR